MDTLALRTLSIDELATMSMERAVTPNGDHMPMKQVADAMNLPLSVAYDISGGRRPLRAREVPALVRATRSHAVADAIEHQLGRVALFLPVAPAADDDPAIVKAAKACKQFGEFMEQFGAASSDRRYTHEEAERVRLEAQDAIAALMEVVAQVDAMKVPAIRAVRR